MEPAARTLLIARMWRPCPPSVGWPVLLMPSVVPKIAASMSCTATAFPASTACTYPLRMNHSKSARARGVHQRRSDDPDQVAAAALLLAHPRRELLVVDRPLAAHLGGHEAELVGAVGAEEALGVDHDPLGAVLRLAHRHQLALPGGAARWSPGPRPASRSRSPCAAGWARPSRRRGRRWEVRGGEEAFRQNAVGGQRLEARLGRAGERRLAEIGQRVGAWGHTRLEG